MRIGLFTDSYHPTSSGVVVVVDVTRRELEKLGHEVFIIAPDGGVLEKNKLPDDDHIIRLPAIQYDMQLSVFFPPTLLKKIRALRLDVIHFFTPAQIGLMAALAARKTGAVLIGQHCTDTYEFSKDYPAMVLGYVLGGLLGPLLLKLSNEQKKTFAKLYLSPVDRNETDEKWAQRLVAGLMSLIYANCDGVVVVSQKSADQLAEFAARFSEKLNLHVIPTGVDILPPTPKSKIDAFKKKWKIAPADEVIVNFGRMAEEKNLTLLIKMLPELLKKRPNVKLLLAGDYVYREKLEKIAAASPAADRIIFSGRYPRNEIPTICAAARVFAFPSLTDTQALVLNEAAGQGLPIVMCDQNVNEVFRRDENGLLARNDPDDFADKIAQILTDDVMYKKFSNRSRELAAEFSALAQTEKLVELYRQLLRQPLKDI
ncbi:glycosyltransferase [Candidatus Saccharibacteria bacterium]|nr:glycosyltransferase [Candidatus Saccharibacteria bacterium]